MKRLHVGWHLGLVAVMASGFSAACSSDDPEPGQGGTGGASTGGTKGDGGANTGGKSTGGANTGGQNTGGTTEGGVTACETRAGDDYPWFWLQPADGADGNTDAGADDAGDAGGAAMAPEGKLTIDVEGTVTAVERTSEPCKAVSPEPPSCPTADAVPDGLVMRIATGDAGTRTFILGARTAQSFVEGLRSTVGKQVRLRTKSAWHTADIIARGFVLSDPGGTVMAYDAGPKEPALVAADHADIRVSVGADVCSRTSSCGDFVMQALVFRGDTEVGVAGEDGEFTLNDWRYSARTRGATRTVKTTCPGTKDADPWLLWRKARLSVDGGAE